MQKENFSGSISEGAAWAWFAKKHKALAAHLRAFEAKCRKRQDQGEFWWELRPCDYYEYFALPKIIFPDIAKGPRFHLDSAGFYLANTAYCVGSADKYLLAILNSRLFWFAISNISIPFGIRAGEYRYRLIYQYMSQVPIRAINFSHSRETAQHQKLLTLVDAMIGAHAQLATATTRRALLQRQIDATDAEIDRLVYDLYGLTPEEIALIEKSSPESKPPASQAHA